MESSPSSYKKSVFPQIDDLLFFFSLCVPISLVGSAPLLVFGIKNNQVALINHCAIPKINAFIPTLKGRREINHLIVSLTVKIANRLSQIPLLRNTVCSLDPKLGSFTLHFGDDLVAQVIKFTVSAKIENAAPLLHRLPNFCGYSFKQAFGYINGSMSKKRADFFFHTKNKVSPLAR